MISPGARGWPGEANGRLLVSRRTHLLQCVRRTLRVSELLRERDVRERDDEIANLQNEAEMSIEELMRRYKSNSHDVDNALEALAHVAEPRI